ncbi:MAG: 4-hydroxy-tetrahydrodipicolinate reductase [Clostridiaceae bacterium]|jgi:4-hydroxy-tetrahydrodipicolinate reductase|nr:4-hydroxy-tetrahydrodipicolinate reductase [Clostridiaceae bacterium]
MNIIITGIGGRLGRAVYAATYKSDNFNIVAGVDLYAENTERDFDVPVFKNISDITAPADVIIDFSNHAAFDGIIDYAVKNRINAVIATTGLSPAQDVELRDAAKTIAVFKSSNMSLGVNLITGLAKDAAKFLGEDYDVEIIEQHHNRKLDAPSGTAVSIAKAVNEALLNRLEPVYGRHDPDHRREKRELGIHAVRGGSIIGKHDIMFIGQGETVTLSHEANSKDVFVYGALRAASFLADKKSGLYDMNSILARFYSVTNISAEAEQCLFTAYAITPERFSSLLLKLAERGVILDMISQTPATTGINTSFTLHSSDCKHAETAVKSLNIDYSTVKNAAKLTIEGAGMPHRSGVAMEVLNILSTASVTVHAITTSETKISLCVKASSLNSAAKALKNFYGLK